jgi:hypothetical protein
MTTRPFIGTDPALGLPADQCPFPGIASYDLDRRDSFKGRDQEAIEFARIILGQRLTILTAGSGDGKTSLIHAGLAPLLMREGIEVAVAEPGGHAPVAEIGGRLLSRLMPLATDNLPALGWLRDRKLGPTLRDVRAGLLAARSEEAVGDRLGVPTDLWPAQRPLDLLKQGPLRTWLTNGDVPDGLVDDAMRAIGSAGRAGKWPGLDEPLDDVIHWLENIPAERELARLDTAQTPEAMKKLVLKRLERAFELRAQNGPREIVFVIDQFEEIFVQFRGRGTRGGGGARWHHRRATFALLKEILARPEWPLRMVLSLRKEHYAELDSVFLQGAHSTTYHLAPLHKSQALLSLQQLAPVARSWAEPGPAAFDAWNRFSAKAVDVLAADNEGSWVDATQLSSLGRWLWNNPLPTDVEGTVRRALSREIEAILSLPDTALASAHPGRSSGQVRRVATTIAEQQEALDILARLRIPTGAGGGRRLSLPMSALEAPPWRNRGLRREIIKRLRQARLIRQDRRNDQDYLEIVHERMIDVIEDLRQSWKNAFYIDLDQIIDHLRAVLALDPFGRLPLSPEQFTTLHLNRERLDLPDFAASRLLDSLLATPDLWDAGPGDIRTAVEFLLWLADGVDGEARYLLALDPHNPDDAQEIRRRLETARETGELASPALAAAAADCDAQGVGEDRATWLLLSSLFHGREGEERLGRLAAKLGTGGGK